MSALVAQIGLDSSRFEQGMKAVLSTATSTASQIAARYAVAASGIDKVFASTARNVGSSLGRELLSAVSPAALGVAGLIAGFVALKLAINAVDDAAKAAQERLAELVKIGADARSAGVGTTFLQSLTGQAKALGTEVGTLTGMLERARDASTVRIGEGADGASSPILDRLRQNVKAGNLGQVDLDRFTNADSQEARIKVILDLVEQLRAKGANLAALDLAGKMFGSEFESKLRTGVDMIGAMRRALDGLGAGDQGRIIPPEEIMRAENLNRRIEEANRMLSEGLAPIQRDIALWQQQQLAGWVDIKEEIAAAAKVLGSFYEKVASIGQFVSQLGQADIFKGLVAKLDSWGLIDKQEQARIERMLNGGLEANQNPGTPKDASAGGPLQISVKPKSDTSRSLPSLSVPKSRAPTTQDVNAIETFVGTLERSAAAIKAEAEAYGQSSTARLTAINLAKAEELAKQNGIALTQQEIDRIKQASAATVEYREKLQDLRENQEFVRSAGGEFLTGIAQDARNGVGALDALNNALQRLAARLEDKALNSLADVLFGKSGGNSSGIFGSLFSGSSGGINVGSSTIGFGGWGGAKDGYVPRYAAGVSPLGLISGPGTGTSDSILAMGPNGPIRVANGESIVTARATRQYRPLIEAMNRGAIPGYSQGLIGSAAAAMPSDDAMMQRVGGSASSQAAGDGAARPLALHLHGGADRPRAETTASPSGPRMDVYLDQQVAMMLMGGSATRAALKNYGIKQTGK